MTETPMEQMNPERLSLARDFAARARGVLVPGGVAGSRDLVAELLADRDYHAAEAAQLNAMVIARQDAELAAGPPSEMDLRLLHATREVARLRARVDEAEAAMAEETRRASAMQHERDEYAADNELWRSEALRLRARVRVEAEDVERAGVTRLHVDAWLRANGWTPTTETGWKGFSDGTTTGTQTWRPAPYDPRGVSVEDRERLVGTADNVRTMAYHFNRPGLDILDEMAAMEVP
jgi:hypothetical protein